MKIKVRKLNELSSSELTQLLKRAETDISGVVEAARNIVNEVKQEGDAAVIRHLEKFDKVKLAIGSLKVTDAEFKAARESLSPELKKAVEHAVANISKFHREQMPETVTFSEIEPGVLAGEKVTPIESVGLYVPRGKGSFPSVMAMLAVPAKIAGVERIIVCTPPNPDGSVDAASLYVADLIGVHDIYKVGGASAIAAMAYGTVTIPKVCKILGPGNQYCSAAKRILYGTVDVGLPAGPSESIILADEKATPFKVALDLMIEAEHGPDSAALLVTHSASLAEEVGKIIPDMVAKLPEPRKTFCTSVLENYGGVVLTDSLDESIRFVNDYAPEHMEVLVEEPFGILSKIKNAGEILLGENTPIAVGNYCLGVNAILPTGSFAKSFSCTSLHSFLKRTSIAYCSKEGFQSLRKTTAILADYEGFPTHYNSVAQREA